ncbi:MAG: hydratase [Clostridiales bacterium]|nr:hydratase [Clostridiales bacterium]
MEVLHGKYALVGSDVICDAGDVNAVNSALAQKGLAKIDSSCLANAHKGTMAYSIMSNHNTSGNDNSLKIKFDAMASHDITYVGIIQTAKSSGLEQFPMPYVMTNCHNSLCAVGGTINEDDHLFGLSAAKRYGGIFVPPHIAVIHQYMREMMAGCGKMILGSDSHTRYGAFGTMAIGEGGPELVKQLVGRTYDVKRPEVVLVYVTGKPQLGVGPQDVALDLVASTFPNGLVKNKVLEFVGPGVADLSMDFRSGIDVMTTETTCLSSIWTTDEKTQQYFAIHGRPDDYIKLSPADVAVYDMVVLMDLSKVQPMIALPFHPSNAYTIKEFTKNAADIFAQLSKDPAFAALDLAKKITPNGVMADQGIIAGCSGGTFENIYTASDLLKGHSAGTDAFTLSVYPQSQPVYYQLNKIGSINDLMEFGAVVKTAFCGPCFGAGDVPANGALSIRHTTRNFPNREGSKPAQGQFAGVALMDARSIAATALNGGIITPATEVEMPTTSYDYEFNGQIYKNRCYNGFGEPNKSVELKYGPNIVDWPAIPSLKDNLVLFAAAVLDDEVTTTDELIPSGETSSYRSNPMKLAEFALSRREPKYVGRAKDSKAMYEAFLNGVANAKLAEIAKALSLDINPENTGVGSFVYATKPGDGSAREQAASCQRVLGGWANVAIEYATKRYRSNCVNWGMLPFTIAQRPDLDADDALVIPNVLQKLENMDKTYPAYIVKADGKVIEIELMLPGLEKDEKDIIVQGCLMNYYKSQMK